MAGEEVKEIECWDAVSASSSWPASAPRKLRARWRSGCGIVS